MAELEIDKKTNPLLKYFGIIGTIVSVLAGSIGLYKQVASSDAYPDLAGPWIITQTCEESNFKKYIGDVYVFEVSVSQNKELFSGAGEQTLYNDQAVKEHFTLTWNDMVAKEGEMNMTFTLGANRTVNGNMKLKVDPENSKHLTGTYQSPIAGSSGKVDVVIQ